MRVEKEFRLRIRTAEGIVFSQVLAGPALRCLAYLLDLGAILLLVYLVTAVLGMLRLLSPDVGQALTLLAYFLVPIAYGIVLEWLWRGQTLGKKILRLRVVDVEGLRLSFSQIALRNLLRGIDALPIFYLVGGLASFLSSRCQRLGDLAANTVVIRARPTLRPDLEQIEWSKYNSLREHPHLEARLRQKVTPAEAELALQALLRRNELDPAERIGLFEELASHFREKVKYPPECLEGISDEQYVRNVLEVVYRAKPGRLAAEVSAG